MQQETKDYLHLHFIVFVWGFTVILGLLISIPPVELVFFRTVVSSIGLWILIRLGKRKYQLRSLKNYLVVLGTGVLIAVHWILFFYSARVSNASVCLAGMATCSLWTSLIEPIAQGQKIRGLEVVLGIVAFIGIGIIFNVEFNYIEGLIIAFISAFIASIFTVINGKLAKAFDAYVITFYEMSGAFVSILLFLPFYFFIEGDLMLQPTKEDWVYVALLAIVCTIYPFAVSVELMKRLSAFSINLIVNLEPVYGIILALLIFGATEEMSAGFYLGTGLILASVLIYPVLNKRYKKRALSTDVMR